jgi:hypothetical protein
MKVESLKLYEQMQEIEPGRIQWSSPFEEIKLPKIPWTHLGFCFNVLVSLTPQEFEKEEIHIMTAAPTGASPFVAYHERFNELHTLEDLKNGILSLGFHSGKWIVGEVGNYSIEIQLGRNPPQSFPFRVTSL